MKHFQFPRGVSLIIGMLAALNGMPQAFAASKTLVQVLADGSQSVWGDLLDVGGFNSLEDAQLTTSAGIFGNAFDTVGALNVQHRLNPGTLTSTSVWANVPMAPQTGSFPASFVATPSANGIDAVAGFSNESADSWADLAVCVRFFINGKVDARNGSGYSAANSLEYSAGVLYLVEMVIHTATKTYSASVTPAGGTTVLIADNYAFRTEQNTVEQLNNFACLTSTGGTQSIESLNTPYTSLMLPPLSAPLTCGPLAATSPNEGIQILKEIHLVPGHHATNEFITITNSSAASRRVIASVNDHYGSDGATTVHQTSSGDNILGPGDYWFVSNDQPGLADISGNPTLLVSWLFSANLPEPLMTQAPGGGNDKLCFSFEADVAAGQSATIVIRRELFESAAQALNTGQPLTTGQPVGNVVFTVADSGPGSLRQVLSNAAPGSTVSFDSCLNGQTILLGGTQITINADVTIDASNLPAGITVSGNSTSRVFEIMAGATVSITGLTITRGYLNGPGGAGAGILNAGMLDLHGVSVSDSRVERGNGAGINNSGILDLHDVTVSGNRIYTGSGAGIHNTGTLHLNSSTVTSNRFSPLGGMGSGGGIFNSGTLTLINASVTSNQAYEGMGGGIENNGNLSLLHTTISANSVYYGSGGGVMTYYPGTLTLGNTIITDNTGYNGVTSNISGSITTVTATNLISGEAKLAPLGNYGGHTATMPPLPGSPAIDAGIGTCDTTVSDQRGFRRVSGQAPDLGAVEIQQIAVNTLADEADGVGTGGVSLRDAINDAGPQAAEMVVFDTALDGGTIILNTGQLEINKRLAIDASSLPFGITVAGNTNSRVFLIANSGTVSITGLTITGGYVFEDAGGGILNSGTLDLHDVTVSGNRCFYWESSDVAVGGGICNGGTLRLYRSTVSGNGAEVGGGGISNSGSLSLVNSTVSDNYTYRAGGGGILNWGNLTLIHTTVSDNLGMSGVCNATGTFTLTNSIIAGNLDYYRSDANISGNITTSAGANIICGDPKLAPLGNYGGRTQTMPPLPGSPAIDTAGLLLSPPPTDQRGATRLAGTLPDIGAVEAFPFSNLTLVDSDGDLIDDRLEPAYGLSVAVNNCGHDSDDDGSCDAEEIANMTDPLNANSILKIDSFSQAAGFDPVNNRVFNVTFKTFAGLSYSLECDQNLEFSGPQARVYPLGTADGTPITKSVTLMPGRDFVRVRRDP